MPKRRTRRRRGGELQTLDSPGPTQRELPVPALPKDDPQLIAQRQLPAPEKEKKWSNLWGLLGGSRRRRRTRRAQKGGASISYSTINKGLLGNDARILGTNSMMLNEKTCGDNYNHFTRGETKSLY